MTYEESKMMWKIERENMKEVYLSKSMKKLYDIVDKCINDEVITYQDFVNDIIDEMTTVIVTDPDNPSKDRADQLDILAKNITKKYEEAYNNRNTGEENTGVSEDKESVSTES